ncbi:Uncharacterised protein [Segatella copri]|nr:Uncharacterised protein [Segatella copri]
MDCLSETHLVGNDSLSCLCSKADALFLVRIEVYFQKIVEFLVIVCLHNLHSFRFFANIDDKVNGIFIASECIADLASLFQERANAGIG